MTFADQATQESTNHIWWGFRSTPQDAALGEAGRPSETWMRHLQHIRRCAQAPTFTSPIASGNGHVMLCRNSAHDLGRQRYLWGGEQSCARFADLRPTATPTPPRRTGSSTAGPALRQRKRDRDGTVQNAADPGAQDAAPHPASGAHQGRPGHPAALPEVGDRALARRQGPLALPGRRRGDVRGRLSRGNGARREIPLGDHSALGPSRPDRPHQPLARRRHEPRPTRLLARSRLPATRA